MKPLYRILYILLQIIGVIYVLTLSFITATPVFIYSIIHWVVVGGDWKGHEQWGK